MRKKVLDKLEALNIDYALTEHPPIYTIGALDELDMMDKGKIAKNLFLRNDNGKQHYLIVIRQDKKIDLKVLRAQIGSSRLSFASEERLKKHMGLTKGSVTPLGVINDTQANIKVYFDEALKALDRVGVHPNENTATVWLTLAAIEKVIKDNGNEVHYIKV